LKAGTPAQAVLCGQARRVPDGNMRTFAFTRAIHTLIEAQIGGVTQLPIDYSVVAGDLVFSSNVDALAIGDFGTALYVAHGGHN
jgi:hypothetical protein